MGEIIRRTRGGKFLGFYLRWYEGGKRRQRASKQATYAEARRMLQAIEGRIARGLAGLDEPVKSASLLTIAELVDRFCAEYTRPRVKDPSGYRLIARTALRRALPQIGKVFVDNLKSADVSRVRDLLGRRYAPASVRLTLAFLGTLFAWAVREGLAAQNPCRGIERPRGRELLEFLSMADTERLLKHTREHAPELYPMLSMALYTGVRKGELFGLRWCDLDFDTRRLDVMRSGRKLPKGGKPRHLRLPAVLVPILRQWRKRCPRTSEGLVFPVGRNRMGRSSDMLDLEGVLAAAGCPQLERPWHGLRHTFASHFVMAGGSILALQKILGHSDLRMTLIYAHLAPDYLGEEMDRLKFNVS